MEQELLTREQRRENIKKLLAVIEPTGLDFHSLQLAVIDLCRSSLFYFYQQMDEKERKAMIDRLDAASRPIAEILNTVTRSPGEDMLVIMDFMEQSVLHGFRHLQSSDPTLATGSC